MVELQPGTQVTPAVRLVRPLAEGGMGKVWIAEHTGLHTEVVVKFLGSEHTSNADALARFEREAAVAAAVKSPHVVQVLDYGVMPNGGPPYMVMERLEGHDLAEHIERFGKLAPRDVAALVSQVAKGLGKAHQIGVVHRDIKPSNIFLCDGGDGGEGGEMFVKLLDFGVAKHTQLADKKTTTGMVIGTPHYMSPEQILGDAEITPRSDIWSLGVVAFQAITAKLPFDGATVGAITLAIHHSSPRMRTFVPDLPEAIDEWFARCCARSAKDRFSSAREAAQALAAAIGDTGAPSLVRPTMFSISDADPPMSTRDVASNPATSLSTSFPVPTGARRKPPLAWLVGAGAAIVALVVITAIAFRSSSSGASEGSKPPPPTSATAPAPSAAPEPSPTAVDMDTAAPAESAPAASATAEPAEKATAATTTTKPSSSRPHHTTTPTSRPVKKRNDDDIK